MTRISSALLPAALSVLLGLAGFPTRNDERPAKRRRKPNVGATFEGWQAGTARAARRVAQSSASRARGTAAFS